MKNIYYVLAAILIIMVFIVGCNFVRLLSYPEWLALREGEGAEGDNISWLEGALANSATYTAGNVGIGTISPTALLEVNGNVKIGAYTLPVTDGTADQVLKTNGAGILTWANDIGGGIGDDLGSHTAAMNIILGTNWLSGDGGDEGITVAADGTVSATSLNINGVYTLPIADGTGGYVLKTDGSGTVSWQTDSTGGGSIWTDGGTFCYYTTGNVGIGTITPGTLLDVNGTITVTKDFVTGGDGLNFVDENGNSKVQLYIQPNQRGMIQLFGNATSNRSLALGPASGGLWAATIVVDGFSDDLMIYPAQDDGGGNGARMLLGDTTVKRFSSVEQYIINNNATGNEIGSLIKLTVNKAADNYTGLKIDVTETLAAGTDNRLLDVQVGGTSMFMVKNNGNVGIGITNPLEKLEVNGGIKLGTSAGTNDGTIRWSGTDFEGYDGGWVSLTAGGGGDNLGDHTATTNIILGTNWLSSDGDAEGINIDATGNVGIGKIPQATRMLDVMGQSMFWGHTVIRGTLLGEVSNFGLYNYQGAAINNRVAMASYLYSSGGLTEVSKIGTAITDITGGAEDADLYFHTIGSGAMTEKMRITGDGNVGIGKTNPQSPLTVKDDNNGDIIYLDGVGGGANLYIVGDVSGTAIGSFNASARIGFVDNVGFYGAHIVFETKNGAGGPNTTTSEVMRIEDGGNVGIGTTNPLWRFQVGETANYGWVDATGAWQTDSDIRYKENIKDLENCLDKVMSLRAIEYNTIGDDTKQVGFVAQELEEVIPEVVSTNEEGYKGVSYSKLTPVLLEAIKELKAENDELRQILRDKGIID